MRAALYARFSTESQNPMSTADQLALCRRHAERLGAHVVAEFADDGISGFATGNRPEFLALMEAARAGRLDVVVAEHLDRLSRGLTGTPEVFEDLRDLGIPIDTVNQGRITTMHAASSGMVSAMMIEEGARKTRRGMEAVVRKGKAAGGRSYGYRLRREYDAAGEPIRGLREIHPEEAKVVVRIFQDYAAGLSPRAIASALNTEGVAGPRGGWWNASTIRGNPARGDGVLHNSLYRGEPVWGRSTWRKDRRTGKRRSRRASETDRVAGPADESLRIVDDALWRRVQDRVAACALGPYARAEDKRRPVHLLSGLARCGVCQGSMVVTGAPSVLRCSTSREKGVSVCANGRSAPRLDVEARVLGAIKDCLLDPQVIAEAVREIRLEHQRRKAERLKAAAGLKRELADVVARASRIVDLVADGLAAGPAVRTKLETLEARRLELEAELQAQPAPAAIDLHPAAAGHYRRWIENLQAGLNGRTHLARTEAREALRQLIKGVWITPGERRGEYRLELESEMAPLLEQGGHLDVRTVGAGIGFEPMTFRL